MHRVHHSKRPAKKQTPRPHSTDHLEQHAADVARDRGHATTTDEDRETAYREMNRTAPKVSQRKSPEH